MTSNQFAFLVVILLLGFGGYLSHPIVPPEIGGPLVVLFILGLVVVLERIPLDLNRGFPPRFD